MDEKWELSYLVRRQGKRISDELTEHKSEKEAKDKLEEEEKEAKKQGLTITDVVIVKVS